MEYQVYYSQVDLGFEHTINEAPYIIVDARNTQDAEIQCVRMLRHTQKWGSDTELFLDGGAVIVAVKRFEDA